MKLLFDHNLSPRLVDRLAKMYPNSQHLFLIGLDQADDLTVWEYARQNEFTVVTRDADFNELSKLLRISSESDLDSLWQLFNQTD